ncbi:hypothetical protein [Methylomonas sp. AM2-LC]|uniref:hypothetical protein n=1 Tax=Methylomonas sp. AM2-LC TaxID=3153301 RepID=UPI0032642DF0
MKTETQYVAISPKGYLYGAGETAAEALEIVSWQRKWDDAIPTFTAKEISIGEIIPIEDYRQQSRSYTYLCANTANIKTSFYRCKDTALQNGYDKCVPVVFVISSYKPDTSYSGSCYGFWIFENGEPVSPCELPINEKIFRPMRNTISDRRSC